MSKLSHITDTALDRVLELAGQAGDGLKSGSHNAAGWLKTGAAIGALKTGGKVATKVVRRNPGTAIALAALGAGVLGYAAYRKRQKAQQHAARMEDQMTATPSRQPVPVDDAADIDSP